LRFRDRERGSGKERGGGERERDREGERVVKEFHDPVRNPSNAHDDNAQALGQRKPIAAGDV